MEAAATTGMGEAEFWETTPIYLAARLAARTREIEREEGWKRWEFELHRAGYAAQFNIQLEQKDRLAPADWFPFPWDAPPAPKPTLEENKKAAADHIRAMGYADGIPVDQFFAKQ